MMPSPDRQIHFRPRVILTFDLPTPKVDRFMPLLRGPRVPICIKIGSFFFKFGNWRMNERTDERKDRLRTLPLRLPVWHGGCKKCLSVMLLRPHFIILASCKPGIRPGLQPRFRQVRAGLRHAFDFFCRKPGRKPAASISTCRDWCSRFVGSCAC